MNEPKKSGPTKSQWILASAILAITAAVLLYRILVWKRLEQTSALFIGIPAVLAMILVMTPRAKTTIGLVCKVTAIALLLSGVFLGEGFICIVMESQIFFEGRCRSGSAFPPLPQSCSFSNSHASAGYPNGG